MQIFNLDGNGQSICSGCIAKNKQPLHWTSMLVEVRYDGGSFIGRYCSECLSEVKKYKFI